MASSRLSSRSPSLSPDSTKCSICHNPYNDPRLLPCLHSFCKSCLVQLQTSSHTTKSRFPSNDRSIKCPLCRSCHNLPTNGVDGFLPNTQLDCATVKQNSCGQCSQFEVISYCVECDEFLCNLCDGAHKRMTVFRSHKLVVPSQAAAQRKLKPKSFKCPQHSKEALEVYCITCKTVICRDCALYSHNSHKFKPAGEATSEITKNLRSHRSELQTQLTTFQSHAQEIAKVEKHVTTYPDAMKSFITSHFDKLSHLLAQRKQSLLNEVDTNYNSFSKSLWAEKEIVETAVCSIEAGIRFADQLIAGTDKLEVAVLGTQALSSMKKAKSLSWNPKTIENLGPLTYEPLISSRSHLNEEELLKSVGQIKVMREKLTLTLSIKGYQNAGSSSSLGPLSFYTHQQQHVVPAISKRPYEHYNVTFKKNQQYRINATTYLFDQNKILFPDTRIHSIVTWNKSQSHGEIIASSCHFQSNGVWMISFITKTAGDYDITGQLQVNGDTLQEAKMKIIFQSNDPHGVVVIGENHYQVI